MSEYWTIALELIVGFLGLFFLTKLLGKTNMAQITPFDFISALILGELVGNAIYDDKISIIKVLFAITLWGVLMFTVGKITQKVIKLRRVLLGEPSIVIRDGQFQYITMKKNNMDINQLLSLIRQKGYFSIQEVKFVILEPNGKVSVVPHSDYDVPNRKDLKLGYTNNKLPVAIIQDGQVVPGNLEEAGVDEPWLKKQLSAQNIDDYKDVLYAEWNEGQPLIVNKYGQ